jgi:hypothetical protein
VASDHVDRVVRPSYGDLYLSYGHHRAQALPLDGFAAPRRKRHDRGQHRLALDQSISGCSDNEFRIEVYRPPYMFRSPRPVLTLPGSTLTYGQSLSIGVPTGAKAIKKVAIIRNGSTTHTNNMDQRYVGLKITSSTDTGLTVTLPPDGTVAPPGPYLLFVIGNDANNAPVPSVGTSVMLGP